MSTRERLTSTESYLAYLMGGGILIAVVALLLRALGTIDDDNVTIGLLLIGLALLAVGIGAWLILVRPWEKFDDLKTPYFVGHEEEIPKPETAAEIALGDAVPAGDTAIADRSAPEPPAPVEASPEPVIAKQADDLTLIEGIGPRTADALAQAGITTFAQLSTMQPDAIIQAARAHGARVGKVDTWPAQARQIMGGDLTELGDYQARVRSGTRRDDLTQIEGIGPKVQSILYAAKIFTFDDLAQAAPDALRTILQNAGLRMIQPDTWPEQAAYIKRDDLSGLKKLQDELRAGRHRKTE